MPRATRQSSRSTAVPASDITPAPTASGKGGKRARKVTEAQTVNNATNTEDAPARKKKKGVYLIPAELSVLTRGYDSHHSYCPPSSTQSSNFF